MTAYMILNNVYTVEKRDVETMNWTPSGLYCRTHFLESFYPYTAE